MAFGSKATTGNSTYTPSENSGNQSDVFFPTGLPKGETSAEYSFRIFADEDEVIYREISGEFNIGNGRTGFRTCIVAYGNPYDQRSAEIKAEIDAIENISDEARRTLYKERGVKWSSPKFAINVLNTAANKVQVLKGSWNKMKVDDFGNTIIEGRSMYANLLSIQGKARVRDPQTKKPVVLEIHEHDIILTRTGTGLGTKYSFTPDVVNTDPLTQEQLDLPRFDLEGWVTKDGVWPNEAVQRLMDGESYYDLVKEFNIQLYPVHRQAEVLEVGKEVVEAEEEEEYVF